MDKLLTYTSVVREDKQRLRAVSDYEQFMTKVG